MPTGQLSLTRPTDPAAISDKFPGPGDGPPARYTHIGQPAGGGARIAEFAREVRARLATLASELDPVEDMLIEPRDTARLNDLGGRLGAARRGARPHG
jgi:hypothetical protein